MLGSCNETDFISRLLVGLAAVRAFPETDPARHTMVQSVPVDVTAAALCDLCAPRGPRRGEVLHVVSGAPPQPMASLRQALLAVGAISPNLRAASLVPVPPASPPPPPTPCPAGPPFDALPAVPFQEWMRLVRLEAQLSLWPLMAWAAEQHEFPTFNRRGARLGACCAHVTPATAAALRRGADNAALHRSLRVLFATSGRLRWDALRSQVRTQPGASAAQTAAARVMARELAEARALRALQHRRNFLALVTVLLAVGRLRVSCWRA